MSDITIVTAFFDIGRGSLPKEMYGRILPHYQHRTVDQYFDFFRNLAKIKNDIVVYTSQDLADKVLSVREEFGLKDQTHIVICDSYLPPNFGVVKDKVEEIMRSTKYIEKVQNPHLIEYWHSDYVLVNIFKSVYVADAVDRGLVRNDVASWIDFGYCRDDNRLPESQRWSYDFDKEKIHFFNIRDIEPDRPIDSIIYTGDVYIQGCHIVAGKKMWKELRELVLHNLNVLLNYNLIDDDQTLLLMAYLTKPELFELRYVDSSDWFIIFKNYNDAQYNLQTT